MKENLHRVGSSKEVRCLSGSSKKGISENNRFGGSNLLFKKVNERKGNPIEECRLQKQVKNGAKHEKTVSRDAKQDNEYIRSLYKKYLGKENQIHEAKCDKKQQQIQRKLFKDHQMTQPSRRQDLSQLYQLPISINNVLTQEPTLTRNPKKPIFAATLTRSKQPDKEERSSRQFRLQNAHMFQSPSAGNACFDYSLLLQSPCLDMLGNKRSSLVRCLQSLRQLKQVVTRQ